MDIKEGLTPQSQSHRMVYFSLVCPETVGHSIRGLQQWAFRRHGAMAAMKSPPHITLVPPFWWPADALDTLSAHAAGFRFTPESVSVRLEGFGHFGKRVLYVHVEPSQELQALQEAFGIHMRLHAGKAMTPDDRPFHPHVTIATRDLSPAAFREAWDHFSRIDFRADADLNAISMMLHNPGAWNIHRTFVWSA